jgi:hypothetical protein
VLRLVTERIYNLFASEPYDFSKPADQNYRESMSKGYSLLCATALGYLCYSYSFAQFKVR